MKTAYPMVKMMLLNFLCENKEGTGYDFLKYAKEKGMPASAGTVYPQLSDLLDKKLIDQKIVGRRKLYSLTPEGNNFVKQLRENTDTIKLMMRKIGIVVGEKNPSMPEEIKTAVKNLLYVLYDLSSKDFNGKVSMKESLKLIVEVEDILRRF
ncbi:PadR family transcriptional regulator [Athalassotoga sp.]|uniref:PadR family transcriptional regulator n=1 Tax=Athalassotoga sp. TaxID=2022597 RepID=UPI003D089D21